MRPDEAARIIQKEKRCVLADCERPECKNCGLVMDMGEILEALDMAISALEKQEQDRWIPVTERLPDKSEDYLVTNYIEKWGDKITETCEAYYVHNDPIYKTSYWCGSENHRLGKVLAWRPLPEPFQEEEE